MLCNGGMIDLYEAKLGMSIMSTFLLAKLVPLCKKYTSQWRYNFRTLTGEYTFHLQWTDAIFHLYLSDEVGHVQGSEAWTQQSK